MEAVRLYVEGVHRANCLKKIDSLKDKFSDLKSVYFDMSTRTLRAEANTDRITDLDLQKAVENLGFQAHVLANESEAEKLDQKADQDLLIRLGVAAVSAENVMLLAISIYSGASGTAENFMN